MAGGQQVREVGLVTLVERLREELEARDRIQERVVEIA